VNDLVLKSLNGAHRLLLTISGGRIGGRAGGMPVLELTTTGRRSGRPHAVMLTSPVREGQAIVLVASRGGDDRHPDWYLNLSAHPEVTVRLAGEPARPMRARTATGSERERLWSRVVAETRPYAGYQAKTARTIPLVVIEPV
jgi:deazaflavin-dependent oxidoreductase (nitroreductase family)